MSSVGRTAGPAVGAGATSGAPATASRGRALVVDDRASNRALLEALLVKEGFEVLFAVDGRQGVSLFEREGADIVFMDVMMPVMDGYEATRRIKALAGDCFVPVIFVTSLSDTHALARCIEVGGDDFLNAPYEQTILRARILAAERVRDLNRKIQEQNRELNTLHNHMQREQEIAERIFSEAVTQPNVALNHIRTLLRPAATFNGDLLLTARRPSGELNVLLGDFTGHGLAAAVGALPTAEVFRAMTSKGFSAADILREINYKLATLLPPSMFLAACFLTLDPAQRSAAVWSGGMPEILVIGDDGALKRRVPSMHLPLGINTSLGDTFKIERLEVEADDRILLLSDGLLDARNPAGEMFGRSRLEALLESCSNGASVFGRITRELSGFCQWRLPDDDITLVEIPCVPGLAEVPQAGAGRGVEQVTGAAGCLWRWSIELHGHWLGDVDPVPVALAQLQELHDLGSHRQALYTVLFELYSNALEHGVLGLDSEIKSSEEGFSSYYSEREERLAALAEGSVRIDLVYQPGERGGSLLIRLEDSGEGFPHESVCAGAASSLRDNKGFSGRGIPLLTSLCESLHFEGAGNCVEAVYNWDV
jgi:CheY-like chemotaxis protein